MKRRLSYDSQGNRAEIILFSELNIPEDSNMKPEDILGGCFDTLPDIGFGDPNRPNPDSQKDTISALRLAFTLLTARQRTVVYKKYYQGKTNSDIARELHITSKVVGCIAETAVKNLKYFLVFEDKEESRNPKRRIGIDRMLFDLKFAINKNGCVRKEKKEQIYKLLDQIDEILLQKQHK
jgi:hypothetical protein